MSATVRRETFIPYAPSRELLPDLRSIECDTDDVRMLFNHRGGLVQAFLNDLHVQIHTNSRFARKGPLPLAQFDFRLGEARAEIRREKILMEQLCVRTIGNHRAEVTGGSSRKACLPGVGHA